MSSNLRIFLIKFNVSSTVRRIRKLKKITGILSNLDLISKFFISLIQLYTNILLLNKTSIIKWLNLQNLDDSNIYDLISVLWKSIDNYIEKKIPFSKRLIYNLSTFCSIETDKTLKFEWVFVY